MGDLVTIELDAKQLLKTTQWLNTFNDVQNSPEIWSRPINLVGSYIAQGFGSQSSPSGNWQPLSMFTQDIREQRGYGRDRPILRQSNDLYRVSALTLANWRRGATSYMPSGNKVAMSASVTRNQFTAKITGAKVANQTGGKMEFEPDEDSEYWSAAFRSGGGSSRPTFLPARPFFYIHPQALPQIASMFAESLMSEWQSVGARLGTRRKFGRVSIVPMGANTRRDAIRL